MVYAVVSKTTGRKAMRVRLPLCPHEKIFGISKSLFLLEASEYGFILASLNVKIVTMQFEYTTNSLGKISSDALLFFAFSDGKKYLPLGEFKLIDEILDGELSKVCNLERFKGDKGELITVIPAKETLFKRVFIVGLGKEDEFILDFLRKAAGHFAKFNKHKIDSVSLKLPGELEKDNSLELISQVIAEGFMLGSYEFNKYKEAKKEQRDFSTVIISTKDQDSKAISKGVEKAKLFSKATILARDLVNEQASVATPSYLADLAKQIAKENPKKISCKVLDKGQAEKLGLEAFLSIAKASDIPPKFIVLEYKSKNKAKRKVGIIGKGITFDSGGINVKPGDSMQTMKCDMSGAAAVLGAFSVISALEPEFDVIGIIAATPNLISGTSTVPGDVAKALNGKTIEILNTDAEGRVTMADSLSYAVKMGATELIDLATLTGAAEVALGTDITALFSNNANLADKIKAAAFTAGEKVWELPLEKEYKDLNKSEVADVANIPNTRYGGAITAALFLEEFVDTKPWVHLDIAGPAFITSGNEIGPKGGTGFGVRTLLNFFTENKL